MTPGGSHPNPYTFSTKEYNPKSDLIYFGARYYSPKVVRWITKDPLGIIEHNLYVFVGNNPVNFIDPWGWYKEKVGIHMTFFHFSLKVGQDWFQFGPADLSFFGRGRIYFEPPMPQWATVGFTITADPKRVEYIRNAITNSILEQPDFNAITRNCLGWVIEMVAEMYMRSD